MLLPDKHIRLSESIIGLAALVFERLDRPLPFDRLMVVLAYEFESLDWPAAHTSETVSLALTFLFSIGVIDVTPDGDLYRCA